MRGNKRGRGVSETEIRDGKVSRLVYSWFMRCLVACIRVCRRSGASD